MSHKYFKLFVGLLTLYCWFKLRQLYLHIITKLRHYPPGYYIGIPIFGQLIYGGDQCKYNTLIGKQGPIITTVQGQIYVIYINDAKLMESEGYKELISRNGATLWKDNVNDFFFCDGHNWFHRRKMVATYFLLQLNSNNLNKVISNVLNNKIFLKIDKCNNNIYTSLKVDMQYIVFAIVFYTIFGSKYFHQIPKETDKIFIEYCKQIRFETDSLMYAIISTSIFGVKIGNYLNHNIFKNMNCAYNLDIIGEKLVKDYENYHIDDDDNIYINNILNDKNITRIEMIRDIILLFRAGDTTTSTIEQAMYYLIKYPNIQNNLFIELINIIKKNKLSKQQFKPLNYLNDLHFLRAFVYESIRKIVHAPHSYPRGYIDKHNIKIDKYNIPKGSLIIGNHFYINHSQNYWEKPNEFYIKHFLDENNKFKKNKYMMTFGSGRRGCPGYTISIKILIQLFASLILRYKFIAKDKKYFDNASLPFRWMVLSDSAIPIIVKMR